jgi:uroporphyrinogen III methyltransferase/synthase
MKEKGMIYLTGGGCGDPGLLTIKAKGMLESCDAVVYDALVNPDFLNLVKPDCEKYYVGKRSSNHYRTQDETNALLVELGRAGKQVVRLKGGDPYVFGRGGEEGEVLYDAGVAFEVIPGITSAIGGLAYAGIPITHRDCASSFQVVTGHLKSSNNELDWPVLARSKGTLVFLMGVENLGKITGRLMENGMAPETPAAVVHRASTPEQRVVTGTLETICAISEAAAMTAPSLIVVGGVVAKREKLRFFDNKPLFGKTFVVTRSRSQASAMVERIRALGGNAVEYPTIRIAPMAEGLRRLKDCQRRMADYSHLIFTSTNAVDLFFEALHGQQLDTRALGGVHVTAIGTATAAALETRGVTADLVPLKYVGEALVEALKPCLKPDSRVLLPRSKNARPMVADALAQICAVEEIPIYETVREEDDRVDLAALLKEGKVDYITFTSSTTAQFFVEKLGADKLDLLGRAACVSIGPITSAKMRELGLTVAAEAQDYTIAGVINAIMAREYRD